VSQLLTLLNRLKLEARFERLTDSQQAAWKSIEEQLSFPERVNLCGGSGTGKSFLAWAWSRELDATYFPTPTTLTESDFVSESANLLIIDNAVNEVSELRRLLAELQMRNGRSALIITHQPNQIGLPQVHLPEPTPQDIVTVYRNFSLLDFYALPPLTEGNLWQITHSVLK
jgi:hypothetical protein